MVITANARCPHHVYFLMFFVSLYVYTTYTLYSCVAVFLSPMACMP